MIKFKAQYENSVLNLPGRISIHKHNVSQYEKIMKEKFPDMIDELTDGADSKKGKSLPSTLGDDKG